MQVVGKQTYIERTAGESVVPVLFLHGFGGSADSFRPLYPLVRGEQITLDLWGFGKSEEVAGWSVFDYAAAVVALLDALGVPRVDLVAHSFGGRIALVLAAKYPQRVRRCVIADGAGVKPRRGISYRFRVLRYKWKKKHAKHFDPEQYGSADYRSLSPAMRRTFVRVVNEDLSPLLPEISCPVLLVWGRRDRDTPLYMAKKMKRRIPDAGLVLYENCGHFAYLEKAYDFAVTVNRFFA